MIESISKFISDIIRVGAIVIIGFTLYLIYNNYDSFSPKKNIVEVQPQNTTRIKVTSAD
ncbi:MAG: hypothetical protein H7196_04125 [candidate division SR1 bacterium]|nr:hypothetical protein [candidate division SR1 bacterium]